MRPALAAAGLTFLLFGGVVPGMGQSPALPPPPEPRQGEHPRGDLFIEGLDAVWTAAGAVLEGASILIRNGRIEAVGADLSRPEGVPVVEGVGRTAIPGIVDEHSHIAATGGLNEGTAPVVPEVRVLDALNPEDFGIYRALQGGVTTARIMHGSSNPIGGQSAVIKTRWGMERGQDLLLPGAPRAVKFALGENVTRKAAQARLPASRFPASRPGVEAIYEQAFTAALEYRRLWDRYRADPAAFPAPPRRDLRLEALVDILEDRILVHAHSYRSDEILMLMRTAERFGFKVDNFTHVLEGYRVADEIREHGAGASTFSDWWQFKLEAYDAIPFNAALMSERGVLTAINSDIPWLQPFMKWEIAKPVQYGGTSKEEALRMLTLNPATMMGVADRVGSIEVGKDGDVVLLTGDPFDAFSRVEMTIVDGIVYYDAGREEETRGEPFRPVPEVLRDRHVEEAGGVPVDPAFRVRMAEVGELDPVDATAELIVLEGGTIHGLSDGVVQDGVLVMEAGRIRAVGTRGEVRVPEGARVVDVSGRELHPGMIDPVTHLGLFEIGAISQATDRNELGDFNPHIRALGAYQPHGRAPFVARARGITTVLTAQRGGVVEGMGSVVQLRGDTWERAEVRRDGALLVDLPLPPGAPGATLWGAFADHHRGEALTWAGEGAVAPLAGPRREPSLDRGGLPELVEFLRRAREYAEAPLGGGQGDEPFEANVWGGDGVVLEAMTPVMAGDVPVFFRADSEWQLRHLFLLLDEFPELNPVVVGGIEASRLADELADRGIPVILTRTRRPTPDRDDSVQAAMRNAGVLHAAGVRIAFGTDDSSDVRTLPEHAAIAVAHGLPAAAAREAVTRSPARILGLEELLGSLEPGRRADILVTDGDPLQPLTRIETIFIAGHPVDPADNDHERMYRMFRERR
jgi:imidazolonepropionase-like amidohydrolase